MKRLFTSVGFALCSCTQPTQSLRIEKNETADSTLIIKIPESQSKMETSSDSIGGTSASLEVWVTRQLTAEAEDTSNYFFIKATMERVCCKTIRSWFFDDRLELKLFHSKAEIDGSISSSEYFFERNKLAGGLERSSAEDFASQTVFSNVDGNGFSKEEDIFSDTTFNLSAEQIIQKSNEIEKQKQMLINALVESTDKFYDNGHEIVIAITREVNDHENEMVKYSISRRLFDSLVRRKKN